MNHRTIGAAALLVALIPSVASGTDDSRPWPWPHSVHFHVGKALTGSDWTRRHPYVTGHGRIWETLFGTVSGPADLAVGAAWRVGHFGWEANVGRTMTTRLTWLGPDQKLASGDPYDVPQSWRFATYRVEAAIDYFPRSDEAAKVTPYLSSGLGYLRTTGDSKVNGVKLSLASGLRVSISDRLDADFGCRLENVHYFEVSLGPSWAGWVPITVNRVSPFVGMHYNFRRRP